MIKIEVPNNPFPKISEVIKKYEKSIEYIASGGINKTNNYQEIIDNFNQKLKNGLDIIETNVSLTELIYVANEMAINKNFIKEILEYDEDDFETILLFFQRDKKLTIYKNLLKIYFNHFGLLNEFPKKIRILEKYIKVFIFNYEGKNKLLNNCRYEKELLFNPEELLIKYQYNTEKIQKQFSILVDYEYMLIMLNFKLIQKIENLEYDEKDDDLFKELIHRKNLFFKNDFTLKEYVVKYLLTKTMKIRLPFNNWQQFILDIIGDPRSSSIYSTNRSSWNKIGEDLKTFFISTLSKEDLKLFLDSLSDSVTDTNYHYRKAFWMAFLDYVIYVKLLVGKNAYELLDKNIKNRFNNDGCYADYEQTKQSAIYIDFGLVKVIEFTHDGSVRIFNNCPIDLKKSRYTKSELRTEKDLIFKQEHRSALNYNWQNHVLNEMNKYLGTNIQIENVYIEEDKIKSQRYY